MDTLKADGEQNAEGDEEEYQEDDDSEEDGEGGETLRNGVEGQGQDDEETEPSSFSRIPTAFLHQHLQPKLKWLNILFS